MLLHVFFNLAARTDMGLELEFGLDELEFMLESGDDI